MMNENNPLFDLCKIRIELIFLNEKNISNIFFYENSLIFYLNKYLYKIDSDNKSQSNSQNNYYFFEFYTKNLNIKSSNIPDTNLLSNTSDFFCNIFLLFDSNEKEELINSIKNSNKPKELSYTLIFINKNLEINLDDIGLDENSFDIIELWTNNINIKECHAQFENVLRKMIIKYRIYQLNQKLDISINDEEKENDDDSKIKTKLETLEIYIKLGNYGKSLEILNSLKESFKVPKELVIFTECEIIINFLIAYNTNNNENKFEYDKKIEDGFLEVIENYKNLRQINLMANAYLKLLYYLSYFNTEEIKIRINEIIDNLFREKLGEQFNLNILFLIYLNIAHIYYKINFKRKFFIFLFLSYKDYYSHNSNIINKNNNKINLVNNINMNYFALLIKNLEKYFFNKKYSSIKNYHEYTYETFLSLSNVIKLSHYKPNKYTYFKDNIEMVEQNNDITGILKVDKIFSGHYQIFQKTKWEIIQKKIYNNFIKYYKSIKDYDKTILHCLNLLQICHDILSKEKQEQIINIIKKKANKVKYINYFNVVKIPVIIKFLPQRGKIKFDIEEKSPKNKENELFIFNPWKKKKENNINYYWTLNSSQIILIKFHNPLDIPIIINNIQLLYISKSQSKKNINCFNYSPSFINIPPKQDLEYEFKFKSIVEDTFNIIGIEYFFEGVKIRQYINKDGNGIFFRYKNQVLNLYNSKIKENINLENIKIYPEIPQIKLVPLNQDLLFDDKPLSLYEFQKYIFNFDIINLSQKYIKQINLAIYAYKKDDYKITLYEEKIKPEKEKYYLEPRNTKKIKYDFIQKRSYLKIEFIIYYFFDKDEEENDINENSDNIIIKPYLYFKKDLNIKNIFSFENYNIISIHNNANLDRILSLEKIYSKYTAYIISDNYYFSFIIKLLQFQNKEIQYEIINKDITIEKGKFIQKKNFKIFLDIKEKLSKAYIKWKINDEINGIINCFDLIRNIFKLDLEQNFDFDIKQIKKEEYREIWYEIRNNTKFSFFNMKLKILLYQENNKNINLNLHLENDIFIDGKLIHIIDEIKPKDSIKISIKVYSIKDISFNTTFFLIDQKLKLLYVPSFSIKCQ